MKKNLFVLFSLILVLVVGVFAREKTEKIGSFSWYTEQNDFDEMVRIAGKAGKPILAVFSATWCGPCQGVKKNVFETEDFKKVADRVVLLYLEQTTKEGAAYNKKYNVNSFPTFKVFSKQGVMLDTGHPNRTVDGFLEWIDEVHAGNNYYELSKKLEKNPNDRESLLRITDKLGRSEQEKILGYLKRAVNLNPDFNDAISHEAYEKLAYFLEQNIPYKAGKEKTDYLDANHRFFQGTVDAYYPDKFKHRLKGIHGQRTILSWFYESGQFEKVLSFFNDFLKRKGDSLDLLKDIPVLSIAVPNYINLGKAGDADRWIAEIQGFSKTREESKTDQTFIFYYSQIFTTIIEYLGEKGQIADAEKYTRLFSGELTRLGQERMKEYRMQRYASLYGILAADALEDIRKQLEAAKGMDVVRLTATGAKILGKMGRKEEARKMLLQLYENEDFFKGLRGRDVPQALNSIAWAMVEVKIVDEKSLEIAKKAVSLSSFAGIMDTLACVHAELGHFEEAVTIETEAMKKEEQEYNAKEYGEKIRKWKKQIK